MRKVKLQMQISLDGFVAGPNCEMDWMVWNWDAALGNYVTGNYGTYGLYHHGARTGRGFYQPLGSHCSQSGYHRAICPENARNA